MGDATTLLFGLEGFRVVSVTREHEQDDRPDEKHDDGVRDVVVEGVEDEQACRDCGVLSGAVHGRKMRRVKDLPHGVGRCGCGGISAAGRAGSGRAGAGRSLRCAARSGLGMG